MAPRGHRAAPVQALALIQQSAVDSQAMGVSTMAAINRRMAAMSKRTIGAAANGADQVTNGFFAGLSDRYLVDAGRRDVYYNLALGGVEGIELPNIQLAVPSFGGSFGGGLALIGSVSFCCRTPC